MKKYLVVSLMVLTAGVCHANSFYQSNNPFPQTSVQNFNNIYESEPAVIEQERKQAKKSWFKRKQNAEESSAKLNEELQKNESFYVFPAQ